MHRINLVIALLMTALAVSACGGGNDKAETKKLSRPKAGQCIAKEVPDGKDFAPDTQTVVPCNEDHAYEIVAVIPVPDELLTGTTDKEKLARRTELADISEDESELRKKLRAEALPLCDEPYREASGLAKLTVKGKAAKKAGLRLPHGNASRWSTLTSPELWVDGTTQLVCSYRFASQTTDKEVPPVVPARSANTKPVMASYLTKDFPVSLRYCVGDETSGTCTEVHKQEPLWVIDMKAIYGKDFLTGANLKKVNKDQNNKIIQACTDPYTQTGGSLSATTEMGWRFYSDVPTTGKTFPIICALKSQSGEGFRGFAAYQ